MDSGPQTQIWVGYRAVDVIEKLPTGALGAFDTTDKVVVDGFSLRAFSVGGDIVGFGVQVYRGDWYDGAKEINFMHFQVIVADALRLVREQFKRLFHVDADPGLFVSTDYPHSSVRKPHSE